MVVLPHQSSGRPHPRSTLEYLHAGGALVWNALPRSREVVTHVPDRLSPTFSENDVLQDEKVLPGFRCAVEELFR